MHADDLALIAESNTALQAMLNLVYNFSLKWYYQLNALKSAVLVFGESASSRTRKRAQRSWHIGSETIQERDSYHHLGVLRSVSPSSNTRTSERCSSCRSAFYSLNALGTRAGCLHPLTSLRLYKAYCIPILLYGCELWSLTQSELTLLERTQENLAHHLWHAHPLQVNSPPTISWIQFHSQSNPPAPAELPSLICLPPH